MKKILILLVSLLSVQPVLAWIAIGFGGSNWIIVCNDWSIHTYHGSSAGLDTVAPALCPGGVMSVEEVAIQEQISTLFSDEQPGPGYAPFGYPCTDCEPCPNESPGEFCSTVDKPPVYERGTLVWSLKKYSPEEQRIMKERYNIR